MQINKKAFQQDIFESAFNSNYNQCAKVMGIKTPQMHRFINKESSKAGAKFIGGLFEYCKKNNLDFEKYIFLT